MCLRANCNQILKALTLAALAVFVCVSQTCGVQASLRSQPPLDYILQESALIAHVRVAGEITFGERVVQVVEILDSARGPATGQFALVACDRESFDGAWLPKEVGEEFILFANRNDQCLYQPLREEVTALAVNLDGALAQNERMRYLLPPSAPTTAAGAIAHLRELCERKRLNVSVRLNEDDVAHYEPDRPLRVEITIENAGEETAHIQNHIDYEYLYDGLIDLERLEKMQEASRSPQVKLFVQAAGQLTAAYALEEVMRRESISVELHPGERAVGSYDLGEEFEVRAGGSYWVWAAVGGQYSPRVLLELPPREEELFDELKELELAADDGPFHVQHEVRAQQRTMPPVEPVVEGAVIEAALAHWFASRYGQARDADDAQHDELVVLRSTNMSQEQSPRVVGVRFLATDAAWRRGGGYVELATSDGPATFRWRTIRIHSVDVQGARATIEIRQNDRGNHSGTSATMTLRRRGESWHVDDTMLLRMWNS